MKKIGLLCLALVLALGSLGIGYAHWTETLEITGDINTGWIDVAFASQYDNDDSNKIDPIEAGSWNFPAEGDPYWLGDRLDPEKDVANTSSSYELNPNIGPTDPSSNWAKIVVTNGYPSYWGSVAWDIKNYGNVPVGLWTVTLTQVSKGTLPAGEIPKDMELTIGTQYYVDADTGRVNETLQAGDDFSFILSAYKTEQIDPSSWTPGAGVNLKGYLDVTVHIEQDAGMKATYDFIIEYLFANWNEIP